MEEDRAWRRRIPIKYRNTEKEMRKCLALGRANEYISVRYDENGEPVVGANCLPYRKVLTMLKNAGYERYDVFVDSYERLEYFQRCSVRRVEAA